MTKETLNRLITRNLGFDLTKGQEVASEMLSTFLSGEQGREVFLLKGYAGTGKTSIIAACVNALLGLKRKVVLLAPTGRAAKVLAKYSQYPANTIHRWIYRQRLKGDGQGIFVLSKNTSKDTVFIVDEASMISNSSIEGSGFGTGHLLEDLLTYVESGTNCKLLLVGDDAQLPPVNLDVSPALCNDELQSLGYSVTDVTLSEVVRQAKSSGILSNATLIRGLLDDYRVDYPGFQTLGFDDVVRLSGNELIESLESSYSQVGIDETTVITYANRRANQYNQGIRNRILWHEEELSVGDLLMVVKNNYHWAQRLENVNFIANGDVVRVKRIHKVESLHGFRFADVTVELIDYQNKEIAVKVLLDTLTVDGPSLPMDKSNELFQSVSLDYEDIVNKRSRMAKIKEDPYFNALQVKYAYAITCHKSQGGQWEHVYIDQAYFRPEMMTREYLRWLYTAFTRATQKVFLVNFNDRFFAH